MALHRLTREVHQGIVEFIDSGRPFALATVLKAAGSTPREAGTKAIIDSAGEIWGTIGGGLMEAEVQQLALQAIGAGRAMVKEFRFVGNDATGSDPVCGGMMRVLVDPAARRNRAAYAQAAEAMRARRRGVLVTRVGHEERSQVSVEFVGHFVGRDTGRPSPQPSLGVPGEGVQWTTTQGSSFWLPIRCDRPAARMIAQTMLMVSPSNAAGIEATGRFV